MQNLQQETDGGVLLEVEAAADGAAGVKHDADTQRQVRLLIEVQDGFRRSSVVKQTEAGLVKPSDEVALFVRDGEH